MSRIGKTFAILFPLFFIAALVALPQNAGAYSPYITLSATAITQTTVTLSWTSSDFTNYSFTSYTVYMSTASNYGNGHPFTPIWSTTSRQQTTTIVSNLSPSSDYYFYILDSGGLGEADSSNLLEVQTKPTVPAIEWQKEYSNESTESVSNLIQTNDGGYAFMDSGWAHGFTLQPATLYKVDSSGKFQWEKTLHYFIGKSIVQTSDYGYELGGEWNTYGTTYEETPAILKTDSDGNIQWYVNYTSVPSFNVSYSWVGTTDGGFAYISNKSIIQDGMIIKSDSSNNTQWTKELTGLRGYSLEPYGVMLFSLTETSDGANAILGVDNPAFTENVFGSIYLAKTEPFLPAPPPNQLPTPIPTPTPSTSTDSLSSQLTIAIITVIILAIVIIPLVLYRRYRKTAFVQNA